MSPLLICAIIVITAALVFYSIGVIGEVRRKKLVRKDIVFFGIGLVCDGVGTYLMSLMSSSGQTYLSPVASTLMAISGTVAIALMAVHIVLALIVLYKEKRFKEVFHRLSLTIYIIWLCAYALGPIGLMVK